MFDEWVIDATMGLREGMFCFVPVRRGPDGEIETIITGMNFLSRFQPNDGRVIGVVHEDGQEAVDQWCADNAEALEELRRSRTAASADRSGEADETSTKIEGSAEGESAVPEADAHA